MGTRDAIFHVCNKQLHAAAMATPSG